jgi:hypothetical protein
MNIEKSTSLFNQFSIEDLHSSRDAIQSLIDDLQQEDLLDQTKAHTNWALALRSKDGTPTSKILQASTPSFIDKIKNFGLTEKYNLIATTSMLTMLPAALTTFALTLPPAAGNPFLEILSVAAIALTGGILFDTGNKYSIKGAQQHIKDYLDPLMSQLDNFIDNNPNHKPPSLEDHYNKFEDESIVENQLIVQPS